MTTEIIIAIVTMIIITLITGYIITKALKVVILNYRTELDTVLLFLIEDKVRKLIDDLTYSNYKENKEIIERLINQYKEIANIKLKDTFYYKYQTNLSKLLKAKTEILFK